MMSEKAWYFARALLIESGYGTRNQLCDPISQKEKIGLRAIFGKRGVKCIDPERCLSSASSWKDWRKAREDVFAAADERLTPIEFAELGTYGLDVSKQELGMYSVRDLKGDGSAGENSANASLKMFMRAVWSLARAELSESKKYHPEPYVVELRTPDKPTTLITADPFYLSDMSRAAGGSVKSDIADFWRQAILGENLAFSVNKISRLSRFSSGKFEEKFDYGVKEGQELNLLVVEREERWPDAAQFRVVESKALGYLHLDTSREKITWSGEEKKPIVAEVAFEAEEIEPVYLRNHCTYFEPIVNFSLMLDGISYFYIPGFWKFGTYLVRGEPSRKLLKGDFEHISRRLKEHSISNEEPCIGVREYGITSVLGDEADADSVESRGLLVVDPVLDLGPELKARGLDLSGSKNDMNWHNTLRLYLAKEGRFVGKFVRLPEMPQKNLCYQLAIDKGARYKVLQIRIEESLMKPKEKLSDWKNIKDRVKLKSVKVDLGKFYRYSYFEDTVPIKLQGLMRTKV